ncbi:hypothetical protein HDU96_005248, partial [Phlyctochytrium bullatum]
LRQSFVKISPTSVDAGWILPEKKKDISLKAENVSSAVAVLTVDLQSEIEEQTATIAAAAMLAEESGPDSGTILEKIVKYRPFILGTRSLRLQPGESKSINVNFEPANLGRFSDILIISAPGGDIIK